MQLVHVTDDLDDGILYEIVRLRIVSKLVICLLSRNRSQLLQRVLKELLSAVIELCISYYFSEFCWRVPQNESTILEFQF